MAAATVVAMVVVAMEVVVAVVAVVAVMAVMVVAMAMEVMTGATRAGAVSRTVHLLCNRTHTPGGVSELVQ